MSPSEMDGQSATGRTVVERPPPGLARGKYQLPPWAIAGIGAAALVGGLIYVVRRFYGRLGK